MTLDDCLKLIPELLSEVRTLQTQNREILARLEAAGNGLDLPVYDSDGLRALGYSKHESYRILRGFGQKQPGGRRRVTQADLLRYQKAQPN